ncbi:MAG: hypothetical protein AAGC60_17860 [Acidobacteriota bacterium]
MPGSPYRPLQLIVVFVVTFLGLAALPVAAQNASVSVPAKVVAGGVIPVTWSGPSGAREFISLDPPGAEESHYGAYEYPKEGQALELRAPAEPGEYEVRYHSGASGYAVLAKASIRVVPAQATVSAADQVGVGESLQISWTGPDNQGDFVSIDEADAEPNAYGDYAYTRKGDPLTIKAPTTPGSYQVRYHLGVSPYPAVASRPLRVVGIEATLEAPTQVDAGAPISVTWTGPDNQGDFLSIDAVGAAPGEYGDYVYVSRGNPVEIAAPDEPGTYWLRYHLGSGGYPAIGTLEIQVGATSATVRPLEPVIAGEPFEVEWTGPGNAFDFLTIVPPDTPENEWGNYGYTRRGNPVRVEAPDEPGTYEVRYLTGQTYRMLGSATVTAQPGAETGHLRVVSAADSTTELARFGAVEVILDASGSMLQRLDGTRRIELARTALLDLVGETIPAGTPFALRVFGHREADSCRTDLEMPLAPLEPASAASTLRSVNAMNLAKTPIAASLRAVRQDLAAATGPLLVVLVTDGEETCDGDPAAAIQELAAAGIDVRVNIVGFAIDELMLKEDFEAWARLGGGRYFDAADGDALRQAVRGALQTGYEVVSGGEVIATGSIDGDSVELPVGTYEVRGEGGSTLGTVTITADEHTDLRLDSAGGG